MTADKMFEELGYSYISTKKIDGKISFINYETKEGSSIIFRFLNKKIAVKTNINEISIGELKAINKKVEELGW